jgi:hypothetical protein
MVVPEDASISISSCKKSTSRKGITTITASARITQGDVTDAYLGNYRLAAVLFSVYDINGNILTKISVSCSSKGTASFSTTSSSNAAYVRACIIGNGYYQDTYTEWDF